MKKIILYLVLLQALYSDEILRQKALSDNLQPIPSDSKTLLKLIDDPKNKITKEKVSLGRQLFFDPRLSKSNLISCNTCHNLGMGGVDGVSAAIGDHWAPNPQHLHSPTVYNAIFLANQFWDGRSPNLADQAKGPLTAPFEMASDPNTIEQKVNSIQGYKKLFAKAYTKNTPITFDLITQTIALFEKTLITPSRFDKFLGGDLDALDAKEKKGLELFIEKRCTSCHHGIGIGGKMRYFVMKNFTHKDIGTFHGNANNLVRVPTLRNITKTAPYFHNGTVWSLKDAVLEMARIQLKLTITDDEAQSIVDFLHSLDGTMPKIPYPQLPR